MSAEARYKCEETESPGVTPQNSDRRTNHCKSKSSQLRFDFMLEVEEEAKVARERPSQASLVSSKKAKKQK